MEDSEEESMITGVRNIDNQLENEERKKFRNNLAQAITDCEDGQELDVIFKMSLVDHNFLRSIYSTICRSLQEELGKIGQYNIEPFESVANGIYLKTENELYLHIYSSSSTEDPNISYTIEKVLEKSKLFSDVKCISPYIKSDKVQYIKCVHLETGYNLIINISEPHDLHNSEFVTQLRQSDNRINDLMLFLQIWFKNLNIYEYQGMSKYCLITLIIFYLQNSEPPLLAPIKIIQQNAPKSIIIGNNFLNPTPIVNQMIKGFFKFYSSLEFEKVIIAPYLGKVILRKSFKVFKYPEYEAQMQMLSKLSGKRAKKLNKKSLMCVQDMFHLNQNIANRNINKRRKFDYLKKGITVAHNKCNDPRISIKNLYKSLLVNIIEEVEQELKVKDSLTFEVVPLENELKSLAKFVDQPLNLRKLWTKAYIAAIPQIITAIYKIDMTLLPPTKNCTFKKPEETEELPLPFKWFISSSIDLWTGRDVARSNATFMEDQLAQTDKLYAERKDESEFAVQFNGFITISITENFSSLHIEANSNNKRNYVTLRKFFGSFKWYMRNYNLRHRIHLLESKLRTNS